MFYSPLFPLGSDSLEEGGERTHRDIVHRAEQQVSVGVTVDLGLSLKHHSFIVQRLNDLWLLLKTGETNTTQTHVTLCS